MVKRVIITTILGFLAGIVCWQLAASNGPLPAGIAWSIVFSRGLLGFSIGISRLKIPWWLNGIIFGFIYSLPMAFSIFASPSPNQMQIFFGTLFMGIIYGFLIELITSVLLKARVE
jgi:hypothetical protein